MIKGIDSQIITGRTTDLMKDNSARLKGEEFNQQLQAKMQNNNVQKELRTVTDVKKSEIRKTDENDEGRKNNKRQGNSNNKREDTDVIIKNNADNESNSVSGNELVGYSRISNIDIEI